MARAIEKGATYLDKLCHKFYDEPKGRGKKTDYVCRLCGGPLETYYCEERLYLVKCADCGTLALVKTVNPEVSASVTLARPTLTPPNEWVSVKDAVPDPGERVLATDGIFVGEAYRTSADSWHRHTGFPWRDGVTGRTVKYWMLLSVPPAKEDQK